MSELSASAAAAPAPAPAASAPAPAGTGPAPTGITLHQKSRVLEITFADGKVFRLPYELLRVLSPSAADSGQSIRNIPVLGGVDDIESATRDFARREKPIN